MHIGSISWLIILNLSLLHLQWLGLGGSSLSHSIHTLDSVRILEGVESKVGREVRAFHDDADSRLSKILGNKSIILLFHPIISFNFISRHNGRSYRYQEVCE
jgi:hypothetical protein